MSMKTHNTSKQTANVAVFPGRKTLEVWAFREAVLRGLAAPIEESNKLAKDAARKKKEEKETNRAARKANGTPNESDVTGTKNGAVVVGVGDIEDIVAGLEAAQRGQEKTAAAKSKKSEMAETKRLKKLAVTRRKLRNGDKLTKPDGEVLVTALLKVVPHVNGVAELATGWRKSAPKVKAAYEKLLRILNLTSIGEDEEEAKEKIFKGIP